MADVPDHASGRPPGRRPDAEDPRANLPVEHEEEAAATPRRAASAEFQVKTPVGSQALLREAMDPANESLAEALRLSFRVLQVVMLVLVVLFVFSGFQTVEDGQTGVLLRWGKILAPGGDPVLEPGLKFSRWPYPAGEFVLFADRNRTTGVGEAFWPDMGGAASVEEAIQAATKNQRLRPGRDGLVLTRGGDIAHIRVSAHYDVDAPDRFVYCVEDASPDPARLDADRLVQLSLERAAVHVAARRTLQEFVEDAGAVDAALLDVSQGMLDAVDSGLRVVSVETPVDPTPAFSIKKAFGELQEASILSKERRERARQDAHTTLLSMAGHTYPRIIELIKAYEEAYGLGDLEASEAKLREINERLESEETAGAAAAILQFANAYRAQVEGTLGQEARRFASLLDTYRENPALLVQRQWSEAFNRIVSRPDIEIWTVPRQGNILLKLSGLDHIREQRRKQQLAEDERRTMFLGRRPDQFIRRAGDMRDGPGRQLSEGAESRNRRP